MYDDPHDSQAKHDREVAELTAMGAIPDAFGTYAEELQRQFSGNGNFSKPCPHGSQGTPRSRRGPLSRIMKTRLDIVDELTDDQATAMLAWIAGAYPGAFDAAYLAL